MNIIRSVLKGVLPRRVIKILKKVDHFSLLSQFYFVSPHCKLKNSEYLTFLLGAMYDSYYTPGLEKEVLDDFMFRVTTKEEYISRWYKILRIDSGNILHLVMDAVNLSLPGHQSENQIEKYYQLNQNLFIIRYLQYPLLSEDYLKIIPTPYFVAVKKLSKIRYCELGPGIPHGLFYLLFKLGTKFASQLESIELFDYGLIYRDITFKLLVYLFPNTEVIIRDSNANSLPQPETNPNFFYAKDIFEHLHHPREFLKSIIDSMSKEALIAVDIKDRMPESYQHVTLKLSYLQEMIENHGFIHEMNTTRVKIFYRNGNETA